MAEVEILLTLLAIPSIGLMLLIAVYYERTGIDAIARERGRIAVRIGGALLLAAAIANFINVLLLEVGRDAEAWAFTRSLVALLRLLLYAGVAWIGWLAIRYASNQQSSVPGHRRRYEREQQADLLRFLVLLPVLLPLVWLVSPLVLMLVPALYLVHLVRSGQRAQEIELLWLLAIAARHHRPLVDEVEAFNRQHRRTAGILEAFDDWLGLLARSGLRRLRRSDEGRGRVRRKRYEVLADQLGEGHSLANALESSGGLLGYDTIQAIRVGEETDTLPEVLSELAKHNGEQFRRQIGSSFGVGLLVYYWVLVGILFQMLGFLMYWIVPKLKEIFDDFGLELPWLTRVTIGGSDLFAENAHLLLVLLGPPLALVVVLTWIGVLGWSNVNIPFLMQWWPRKDAPDLLRALSFAVRAGEPLPGLLKHLAERAHRSDLGRRLDRMTEAVASGTSLWDALAQERMINWNESVLLENAARSNHLDWGLLTLAEGMERTSRRRVNFWSEVSRPAGIMLIGLLIAFVCISMFLPIPALISSLGVTEI